METNALALWNQFIESGTTGHPADPVILRSWERCRDFNVNHEHGEKADILTPSEFADKLDERRRLVQVAVPVMEDLYRVLKGMGFMVLLADPEGYILKAIIDDAFKPQANKVMLREGASWSEKSKGTNAIGTSLTEATPMKILAHQHFIRENHILGCAAVPILGSHGQVLGTLDVSGKSKNTNERVFSMVAMSAKNIEQELKILLLNKKLGNVKARYEGLFELMQEGAVIVDENGTVQEISPAAGSVLGIRPDEYLGENIEELFNLNSVWVLDSSSNASKEITISAKHGSSLVKARASRIYSPEGKPEGLVALIGPGSAKVPDLPHKRYKPLDNSNIVRFTFNQIIGDSEYLQQVVAICKRVAKNNSTVLLTGETGTGKEVLAQAIHHESSRRHNPFVAVNCAAIPSELIESELFGYEDGAFTGARKGGNPGKFEQADGGTIFLDEIGDMSPRVQLSLLRVLQERQLCRVGGRHIKSVDVRVIAATHRNLTEMVEEGSFRQDLFFRLNVINVFIPPLRFRKDDVVLLAKSFLDKYKAIIGRPDLEISPEVLQMLREYTWPGNVRELENVIEGLVNMVEGDLINVKDLPPSLLQAEVCSNDSKGSTLKDLERAAITQAIKDCSGGLSAAAARLGIGRSTLYRKIKEYEIEL